MFVKKKRTRHRKKLTLNRKNDLHRTLGVCVQATQSKRADAQLKRSLLLFPAGAVVY